MDLLVGETHAFVKGCIQDAVQAGVSIEFIGPRGEIRSDAGSLYLCRHLQSRLPTSSESRTHTDFFY